MTARRLWNLPEAGDPADPAVRESPDPVQRAALLRVPSLVPVLGVQRANGALWLVSELADGVWLSRLLELTKPRPAQAVVIGLGVLCGLRAVHAAGYAHGSVSADEVRIGGDGQARLDGWATGALCGPDLSEQRQRADITAAGVLLGRLARVARRSTAGAVRTAPALLAALDAAARYAAFPAADIDLVAGPLEAVCGPDEDAAARSELATLVRAVSVRGSVSSAGTPAAGTTSVPAVEATPEAPATAVGSLPAPAAESARRRGRPGRTTGLATRVRELWNRIWTWVVALTVLMAVVSVEFALLHEWLARDVQQLQRAADRPGEAATARPVALPPVASPAPASAGAVRGLDLRTLQPCTPGTVCAVRVLVTLHPQPQRAVRQPAPGVVGWSFQVVDRCTGSRLSVPGGLVSAAPGADRVQAVSTVPLPSGQALAVIAVTNEPAKAASAALPVPARGAACPGN
ncbi:MAG: hypothetical protein ACRDRV_04790 [Pseudonocardiaceae bacterium]